MRKQFIGVLFILIFGIVYYGFVLDWGQLTSIVLLWSFAAFLHVGAVKYLPTMRFSLAMIIVVPLISLHGTEWAVVSAVAMGGFNVLIFRERWAVLIRSCLNYGASALLAGLAFVAFGGEVGFLPIPQSLVPLAISGAAYSISNLLFASFFYSRHQRSSLRSSFATIANATGLNYLVVIYVGVVLAVFNYALGILGLILFGGLLIAFMELMQINTQMHYERNQRLQTEAKLSIDPKTKVYNFHYLHDWLSDNCDQQTSLLFIDIDDFKKFNDKHGHKMGDEALQTVAATISRSVREMDSVVRFGGEEFVVIIPETDGDNALAAAERIKTEVEKATKLRLNTKVTVSIGVASLANAVDKNDLLVLADRAMYQAKNLGKNRCYLWGSMAS